LIEARFLLGLEILDMKFNLPTSIKALTCLNWGLAAIPYGMLLSLWLLAWRGAVLLGRLPQVSWDDPHYLAKGDALYTTGYQIVRGCESLLWFSPILWLALVGISLILCLQQRTRKRFGRLYPRFYNFILGAREALFLVVRLVLG
jgi:hypothetical protein